MNRYFYDLHMHSCLSPCAEDDMTPANIAGMASLNGLQLLALTDHNTCGNCPAFMQACRKYGLYRVVEEGWIENIAVSVIDWGKYYERMLRQMIEHGLDVPTAQKSGQTVNYWWGMSAGVVDLISSPHLHYAASKLISVLKDGIISGQLSPFQGELHAQDRIISGEGGKTLKASDVITMDWLNDNIIGEIPSARMMNEDAQETMNVIGVMPRR